MAAPYGKCQFEQMGGASCAVFALGLVLGLIGWVITLNNKPEPPKITAASAGVTWDDEDEDEAAQDSADKADPYASDHRRRED